LAGLYRHGALDDASEKYRCHAVTFKADSLHTGFLRRLHFLVVETVQDPFKCLLLAILILGFDASDRVRLVDDFCVSMSHEQG